MKKNMISIGIWMCLLWFTLSNCVDKFDAHLPDGNTGLLVVDGNIISDSTVVFRLSRSFSLNEERLPPEYNQVEAEVSVVGSDGSSFQGVALGNGQYQVAIGTLNKEVGYSLKIVYDGDTYTSEPQCPLETEMIEVVDFDQPEDYGDIHIRISTKSKGNAYYLWSYVEDWEVRAVYATRWFFDPKINDVIIYDTPPYARGWCHVESSSTIVGTTESVVDNYLKNKQMLSFPSSNDRFSCLYSTLMKQRKLSKGEYEYYQEKAKLDDEMGGLFTPQPSELPTNITCSNRDKQTIGYVGVNMNVAEYRLYISNKEVQYESKRNCSLMDKEKVISYSIVDLYSMDYRIAYYVGGQDVKWAWAPKGCTDVRDLGATLDKPSFWPDDIN